MNLTPAQLREVQALRQLLHANPEFSGQEHKTKALLKQFLQEHTTLSLYDCGGGFVAAHYEPESSLPGIALRADFDAVTGPDGTLAHLCGHDGHSAALCGAALALEGKTVGRSVFFLFQPAEETGSGAEGCLALFDRETVGEIYGQHNIPGYPLGQVLIRPGTFTCASRGVTLRFIGAATHAAYPELGVSPAPAVGALLCALPKLCDVSQYSGITFATVIGVHMGEKTFGSAASRAEIWLTLRAEHDADLLALHTAILSHAKELAAAHGLQLDIEEQDIFSSTENDPVCAQKVLNSCHGTPLDEPMRWSEDFSLYLHRCRGAFFGVGVGEQQAPLHSSGYEYPDALLEPTIQAFCNIITAQTIV